MLDGLEFSDTDQLRNSDENGNPLDIASIMQQFGRWVENLIRFEIAALKSDGTVINSKEEFFTVPPVDWNIHSDTSLIMLTDTIDETKTKLRVYRVNNTDTIPNIQLSIKPLENADDSAVTDDYYVETFDTVEFKNPGGALFEDFEFIFPDSLDRNKVSKYTYTVRGVVLDDNEYQTVGAQVTKELDYIPWYKPNIITVSLSKSDITEKRATVTVQPLLAAHLTREPNSVRLRFIRDNDSDKKVESSFSNLNFGIGIKTCRTRMSRFE